MPLDQDGINTVQTSDQIDEVRHVNNRQQETNAYHPSTIHPDLAYTVPNSSTFSHIKLKLSMQFVDISN